MKASKREILDIPLEEGNGITESTSSLIRYGVQEVFEAFRADVRQHPGGLPGLAKDWGIAEQTIRAFWNPNHSRSLTLSSLVEFTTINPATNLRNALNGVADTMARHREVELERKLKELRGRVQGACR